MARRKQKDLSNDSHERTMLTNVEKLLRELDSKKPSRSTINALLWIIYNIRKACGKESMRLLSCGQIERINEQGYKPQYVARKAGK